MKLKRLIAIAITVVMVLSSALVAFAQDTALTPIVSGSKVVNAASMPGYSDVIAAMRKSIASKHLYNAEDIVNVIIELDEETLIDVAGANVSAYAKTVVGGKKQASIIASHSKLKNEISSKFEVSYEGGYDYTAIMNAFSASIRFADMKAIADIVGVKRVYVAGTYSEPVYKTATPNLIGSSETIGADLMNETGYTGKGAIVAVIDSGFDYTHEAFGVSPDARDVKIVRSEMGRIQKALAKQLNSAGEGSVISNKLIYAYDYADGDSDVYPVSDHGTHVAGIVAGNNGVDFAGIAPDAQLMLMKVFPDDSDGADMTVIAAALEDSILLGADVVNMSLGSPAGFTDAADKSIDDIYASVADAGVILCCSAGNENNQAENLNAYNLPYADKPDYALVGQPSTYATSFSVASVENPYIVYNDMTVDGVNLRYYEADAFNPIVSLANTEYEYIYCGLGSVEEFAELDVTGKVALISRGELNFQDKVNNAAAAGAVAAIVMNNVPEEIIYMSLTEYPVPAVSITFEDGEFMKASETKKIVFNYDNKLEPNAEGNLMSGFSSWGPTTDFELKPEITAPGGYIYSSIPGGFYASFSGTSMASPTIAGASAVLIQYLKETQPELSMTERKNLIINLMMSTADQITDGEGNVYSPRKQGAGLLNLIDCVTTKTYISTENGRPKASIGSSEAGIFRYTFTVNNIGNDKVRYALGTNVMTDTPTSDGVDLYVALTSLGLVEGEDYTVTYQSNGRLSTYKPVEPGDETLYAEISDYGIVAEQGEPGATTYLSLNANSSADVTVTIKLTDETKEALDTYFVNGTYIEGYTYVTAANLESVSIPFLGFYGDWATLDVFDNTIYEEGNSYYNGMLIGVFEYEDSPFYYDILGENYFTETVDPENIAYNMNYTRNKYISQDIESDTRISSDLGLLRNAMNIVYTITDSEGNIVAEYEYAYESEKKTYYSSSSEAAMTLFDYGYYFEDWDSTQLPEGDYTYTVTAESVSGDVQSKSINFYVDNTAPELIAYGYAEDEEGKYVIINAGDDKTSQGVVFNCLIDDFGYISLDDLFTIISGLYAQGAISYEVITAIINCAPYMVDNQYGEDGSVYSIYDISGYAEFAALCSEYVLNNLIPDVALTLNAEVIIAEAIDYAWNFSEAAEIPVK